MTSLVTAPFVRTMAAYNRWQNDSLYAAAASLSEADRQADRGAFFGSIAGTLTHILWGDRIWLNRFADHDAPARNTFADSIAEESSWPDLAAARHATDDFIEQWARQLSDEDLNSNLTWYSRLTKHDVSKPLSLVVVHFFNHQTHHRGQVHAMLTAAGATPADTDLILLQTGGD